jgi:spermidine synthase
MPVEQESSRRINPRHGPVSLVIVGCFFLSGLAGLIYEVVWARQLALFLGITSHAHTAVITAYMAGLAAGSFYFGRRADRHTRPLIVYAWLEIGVGLYAATTPWLFTYLQTAYVALVDAGNIGSTSGHVGRFAIALTALLLPTFLMGGTLPLLVRGFTDRLPELGKMTSRLYGINTLGAMLGTILAGFLLLPLLGVTPTIMVGVVINLGIAAVVLSVLRPSEAPAADDAVVAQVKEENKQAPEDALSKSARRAVLLIFATAGFAALLTQLAWIRALILVVGGSVYAFTITLASFLAGIGLGSLLYTRYLAEPGTLLNAPMLCRRTVQAALLALLISLTLLLGLPVISKLPNWFLAGYLAGMKDSFALFQLYIFALSFGLMILPTLLMGAMFPLVTVIWTRSMASAGQGVGAAYAINTSGTILGALLGGLFILPWLGVHKSIILASGLYLLVAVGFWLLSPVSFGRTRQHAIAGVAIMAVAGTAWLMPPLNKAMMTSGVFSRPDNIDIALRQQPGKTLQQLLDDYELLYYKEGADATVAVRQRRNKADSQRTLLINGKADASSSGDMPTQVLLAQLPLAMNPQAESALVIGLGSGITAGSLATSESLLDLTILEISDEVVEASEFFEPENYGVLDDPRVRLVTADARNYLMAATERYDLIVSEPSNPWISGIANLFTDEFLQLAKSRLNAGGLMTQWFHIYSMSDADLKTMFKTFDDNFEYVSVWKVQAADVALIGSDQPHALSLSDATTRGARELARATVLRDRDLVGLYIIGGELLSRYVRGAKINSDYTPVIEFSAPRNLYSTTTEENIDNIVAYLNGRQQAVPVTNLVTQQDGRLHAPFMSISITNGEIPPAQVSASWMIDRPSVQINGLTMPGLGSERLMTWVEDPARFQIRAVLLADESAGPGLKELLDQLTQSTGRDGGQIKLGDGAEAIWLINNADRYSPLQLDVAWDCPGRGTEFSRYALHAVLPDAEVDTRRDTLALLADRISCDAPD